VKSGLGVFALLLKLASRLVVEFLQREDLLLLPGHGVLQPRILIVQDLDTLLQLLVLLHQVL